MQVEKELFTSLFRVAMEDVDMFTEMRNCMGRMPWGELDGIGSGHDSSWFKSEVRDSNQSHSITITASQAPEIQPLVPPSISFPQLTLPSSSSQPGTNLDSRRDPHTSEPEVDGSANIDAMDVDEENSATNPQTSSKIYGRMTLRRDKEMEGGNTSLPQIQKLKLKGPQLKPSLKGKKQASEEDEEERDDDEDEEDEDEDEEMEKEEEIVRSPPSNSQLITKRLFTKRPYQNLKENANNLPPHLLTFKRKRSESLS